MRTQYMPLALVAAVVAMLCALPSAAAREVTLVEDGTPRAAIVLAEQPTKAAQLGAFELQQHVKLMTDVVLPIIDENTPTSDLKLCVGLSKAAGVADDFTSLEYTIRFRPDAIVMAGKDKPDYGKVNYWMTDPVPIEGAYDYPSWPELFDERGSLNAVYDFLWDYCGVRWYDPSEFGTDVPRTQTLRVEAKDLRRTPAFRFMHTQGLTKHNLESYDRMRSNWTVRWSEPTERWHEWLAMTYEKGKKLPVCAHPHRWLAYQRSQVWAFWMRHKQGGEAFKCNHSLYNWYDRFWEKNPKNPDVFVEKKPDWFAQGYPEAKVPPQLCYTNPEVVAQCVADARAYFALSSEERAKLPLGTDLFWPVVPMDNSGYCKCPRCAALTAEEDSGLFSKGRYSPLVWTFVNQVAAGLKETHPDKLVAALAYSGYARRPEGMKIGDNIAVQLCLFPRAAADNPEMLANDDAILREWGDGRPLYLWLYASLTTGHMPQAPMYPGFMGSLYDDLFRKYHKAGVRGFFLNGIPPEPETFVLYKLGDNPDLDSDKLLDEYFLRMFGPQAGKTLREFYRVNESTFINPRNHPPGVSGADYWWGALGTAPRMAKMAALIEQAEAQLVDAPELWQKRFAIVKLGTWEYMKEGRAQYEASRVAKATSPLSLVCPATLGEAPRGDLSKVDWSDAQGFGNHNCWLKDSGDISVRRISSAMIHDGAHLYLKLVETNLDRRPTTGDNWEVALFDRKAGSTYHLTVTPAGGLTGQVQGEGVPQEWADHGAVATSQVETGRWEVRLALPAQKSLLDERGRLLLNCRRNDATGEDTAVLVATGNDFDSGKTGALISFDPLPAAVEFPTVDGDLIVDCDFQGTGEKVEDRSGQDNDGTLFGGPARSAQGLVLSAGGQYVEFPPLEGYDAKSFTAVCWMCSPATKQTTVMPVFSCGRFQARLSSPAYNVQLFWTDAEGKAGARGTGAVELTPDAWHQLVLTHDGQTYRVYLNGRERANFATTVIEPLGPESLWRLGGEPKSPPWYTFRGTYGRFQMYKRALTAAEVLGKYAAEYPTYRKAGGELAAP